MRYLFSLFLITGLVLSTGCKKAPQEVKGSVFIATQGGSNIKLGLVDIYALPTDDFNPLVDAFEKERTAAFSGILTGVEKEWPEFRHNLYPKVLRASQASKNLYDQEVALWNSWRNGIARLDSGIREIDHTKHYIIYSDNGREAAVAMQSKFNEMIEKRNKISDEFYTLGQAFDAKMKKIRRGWEVLESAIPDDVLNRGLIALVEQSDKVESKAKSDADGKFQLMLDPTKNYYLVAKAERKIGDSTEKYEWIFELSAAQIASNSEIFLSNDNLSRSFVGNPFTEFQSRMKKLNTYSSGDMEIVYTFYLEKEKLYRIGSSLSDIFKF